MKTLLFSIGLLCTALFVPINLDAEEDKSIPAIAVIAYQNPYYISDFDFGIHILDYVGVSKKPYLTEGLTDESDLDEIARAYEKSTTDITANVIVSNDNRVQFFVAHITDAADIELEQASSFTFSNFNHSEDFLTFTLGSLPSKDKHEFYEIVSRYINSGKTPEPFRIALEFGTGDGTILQTWDYHDCHINDYSVYVKDDIGILNYIKVFGNEIRDSTTFECRSLVFNPESEPKTVDFVPPAIPVSDDVRAMSFAIYMTDAFRYQPAEFYSMSKFEPLWFDGGTQSDAFGKYKVGFALEALPTKDKELYYELIGRSINPGGNPNPADFSIEVLTGDKQVFQTWNYDNCLVTNYTPYLLEFMMVYKFHPDFNSEIRDRVELECVGLHLVTEVREASETAKELSGKPILDDERAFYYVVNLVDSPDIEGFQKTESFTFSSFSYFTDPTYSTYAGIKPDNPIGSSVEFFIEGLSGKDKEFLYQVVAKYINPGKTPEPFDVDIDLVTADGHIVQTWEHEDCQVTDFKTFLDDVIVRYKFQRQFAIEIRDTVWFQCVGYSIDFEQKSPPSDYIAPPLVPVEKQDRANSYIVRLVDSSDADIQSPKTWYTFAKFLPYKTEVSPNTPIGYSLYEPTFAIESLPNPENTDFYQIVSKYTTTQKDPEPFDMAVDVVSTDGYILQTWNYEDCELSEYIPYTNRNLVVLKLHLGNDYEVRDRSIFSCVGSSLEPFMKDPTEDSKTKTGIIPEFDDRALSYVVKLVDAHDIDAPQTFFTFTEFLPSFENPEFTLGALVNENNENFYDIVKRYINPGKEPEPFDMNVEIVLGGGDVLQTWKYNDCTITQYVPFTDDNISFIKYIGEIKSEIKDRTNFECDSWQLDPTIVSHSPTVVTSDESPHQQMKNGAMPQEIICKDGMNLILKPSKDVGVCVMDSTVDSLSQRGWIVVIQDSKTEKYGGIIPVDSKIRATKYVVKITDAPDIDVPKTWDTFSKYTPYTDPSQIYSELSPVPLGVAPGYSFGDKPKFLLESLPSKDKIDFYEIISRYINPGKEPDPFTMQIDLITSDDEILQQWNYDDCQVVQFSTFLNEQLLTYKFHEKFTAEFQDRTFFECNGLSFNDKIDSKT